MANFWTAQNVFGQWDLNPIAAQTGIARDELAAERDAFLAPLMLQFRTAAAASGYHAAEDDYSLFNDPNFRAYVQSGQLPPGGGVTPAAPSTPPVATIPAGQTAAIGLAALGPAQAAYLQQAGAIDRGNIASVAYAEAANPMTTPGTLPGGLNVSTAGIGGTLDTTTILILVAMAVATYVLVRGRK